MNRFTRRKTHRAIALPVIALMLAAGCKSASTPPERFEQLSGPPGARIAETLCSGCHAIGRAGDSPHPDALPFRQIALRYPVRNLEEAFAEGITVGHPDMPPFQFEPDEIDALIRYLESIQDPA